MKFHNLYKKYRPLVKRAMDVTVASSALVAAFPVILMAGIVIRIKQGVNPSFDQDRIGLDGKIFKVHKLTTIYNGEQNALSRFLRRSKIDELPQLYNIIKGEMSLVGPRPLMVKTAIAHNPKRQSVKPGVTGLAQINPKFLPDYKKLRWDLKYIERGGSVGYDCKILLGTIFKMVSSSQEENAPNASEVFLREGELEALIGKEKAPTPVKEPELETLEV